MNIVETLQAGFNTTAKRAWVISIPIALDLYFWLGPKLSVSPLIKEIVGWVEGQLATAPGLGPDLATSLEWVGQNFDPNLFPLFLPPPLMPMPSLLEGRMLGPASSGGRLITLQSGLILVGLALLLSLFGTLLGSLYLELVAQGMRKGGGRPWPARLLFSVAQMVAYGLLLLGLFLLYMFSSSLTVSIAGLISPVLGGLVWAFWLSALWMGLVLLFFAGFTIDAVFINGLSARGALLSSISVVRRNLWAALGLMILSSVIGTGLLLLWQKMSVSFLGMLIGIVGNAFVGTGLVAARLRFYQDRCGALSGRWADGGDSTKLRSN